MHEQIEELALQIVWLSYADKLLLAKYLVEDFPGNADLLQFLLTSVRWDRELVKETS
jgi:hypothetical protein